MWQSAHDRPLPPSPTSRRSRNVRRPRTTASHGSPAHTLAAWPDGERDCWFAASGRSSWRAATATVKNSPSPAMPIKRIIMKLTPIGPSALSDVMRCERTHAGVGLRHAGGLFIEPFSDPSPVLVWFGARIGRASAPVSRNFQGISRECPGLVSGARDDVFWLIQA